MTDDIIEYACNSCLVAGLEHQSCNAKKCVPVVRVEKLREILKGLKRCMFEIGGEDGEGDDYVLWRQIMEDFSFLDEKEGELDMVLVNKVKRSLEDIKHGRVREVGNKKEGDLK